MTTKQYLITSRFLLIAIFVVVLSHVTSANAQKVHALLIILGNDRDIRASVEKNESSMQTLLRQVSENCEVRMTIMKSTDETTGTINEKTLANGNVTSQSSPQQLGIIKANQVVQWIRDLRTEGKDTILIYYSGHGSIDAVGTHILNFDPEVTNDFVARDGLRRRLEQKGARLKMLITDTCSNRVQTPPPVARVYAKVQSRERQYTKNLFLEHSGFLDITAASEGQYAWGNNEIGGYFTVSLIGSFTAEADANQDQFLSWEEVFDVTRSETQKLFGETTFLLHNQRKLDEVLQTTQTPVDHELPRDLTRYTSTERERSALRSAQWKLRNSENSLTRSRRQAASAVTRSRRQAASAVTRSRRQAASAAARPRRRTVSAPTRSSSRAASAAARSSSRAASAAARSSSRAASAAARSSSRAASAAARSSSRAASALTQSRSQAANENRQSERRISQTIIGQDGGEMILIPGGRFRMGSNTSDADSNEQPVHTVHVDAFYMDKYEVTNAQYRKFVLANPQWQKRHIEARFHNGNYLKLWDGNSYPSGEANYPVTYVSWYGAMAYAKWAGKRLPTEVEWECAYGGWWVGKEENRPLTNPYGLRDMAGSVWEWGINEYNGQFYLTATPNSVEQNPLSDVSSVHRLMTNFVNVKNPRVLRGGSKFGLAKFLRATNRKGLPTDTNFNYGFRCVSSVKH